MLLQGSHLAAVQTALGHMEPTYAIFWLPFQRPRLGAAWGIATRSKTSEGGWVVSPAWWQAAENYPNNTSSSECLQILWDQFYTFLVAYFAYYPLPATLTHLCQCILYTPYMNLVSAILRQWKTADFSTMEKPQLRAMPMLMKTTCMKKLIAQQPTIITWPPTQSRRQHLEDVTAAPWLERRVSDLILLVSPT